MYALAYLVFVVGLLVATVVSAWAWLRRFRVHTIVQTLALIVGQNVPLVAALRAAARFERRKLGRVFTSIAHHLEVGDALSTALRTAYPACPGQVSGAIQAGEQSGTLPSVLRTLSADLQRSRKESGRAWPALAYFLLFVIVVPPIVLSLVIFLVPKFRDIFLDFGAPVHPMMESLFSVTSIVLDYGPFLVVALVVIGILSIQLLLGRHLCPRVPDRFQWIPALTDTILWHLPILRQITETRSLARQLPILQAAIRAGHDLVPAARHAACVDANYHARRRMRRWAERIEMGGEPVAQARVLGFPRAVPSALSAARGRDELAAALDYLCSYYRSLLVHWEQLLGSIAMPVIVLVWGVSVAYVVGAIFVSLYGLVDTVMADMY